jgi:hypothetical protein
MQQDYEHEIPVVTLQDMNYVYFYFTKLFKAALLKLWRS